MTKNELLKELKENGFEIYTLEEEKRDFAQYDKELIDDMESLHCDILLHNSYMARNWYFTSLNALINFFQNGGKVGYDDCNTKIN